jgi:hypothetical protein
MITKKNKVQSLIESMVRKEVKKSLLKEESIPGYDKMNPEERRKAIEKKSGKDKVGYQETIKNIEQLLKIFKENDVWDTLELIEMNISTHNQNYKGRDGFKQINKVNMGTPFYSIYQTLEKLLKDFKEQDSKNVPYNF